MPRYAWSGIDAEGNAHKGTNTANSLEHLKVELFEKGIALLSSRSAEGKIIMKRRVERGAVCTFFGHLAMLLESSFPLDISLKLTRDYAHSPELKKVIGGMTNKVECGTALADSMKEHDCFSQLMVNVVNAGEMSGNLRKALKNLSMYLERGEKLRKKVRQAALLPSITLGCTTVIVGALFIFVIPQFGELFAAQGGQLPGVTRALLRISEILRAQPGLMIIGLMLIGLLVRSWVKKEKKKGGGGKFVLRLPLVGPMVVLSNFIHVTQTLSLLLKAGIPLQQAVRQASLVCSNQVIRGELEEVVIAVSHGKSLEEALKGVTLAPPELVTSLAIGEQAGKLELMLEKSALFLEERLQAKMAVVTTMIQPTLIMATGIIIALILLALYLPLFNAGGYFS